MKTLRTIYASVFKMKNRVQASGAANMRLVDAGAP